MVKKISTEKSINLLLSGRHPQIKKYAGKHVMVIGDKIVPLKEGKKGLLDLEKLEKQYGKRPVLTYIPEPGTTYIF